MNGLNQPFTNATHVASSSKNAESKLEIKSHRSGYFTCINTSKLGTLTKDDT